MSAGWVVDASVAVKWFVAEPDSGVADAVAYSGPLFAPDFCLHEIANALGKRVRAGILSLENAERLRLASPSYFDELASTGDLTGRALELSVRIDHPLYDCIYLALAELRNVALVTADAAFARKAARLADPPHVRLLAEWSL